MRHFSLDQGNGTNRKFVVIELRGPVMRVVHGKPDGSTTRTQKELASAVDAQIAADRMAAELRARGFVEQVSEPAMAATGRPRLVTRREEAPRRELATARTAADSSSGEDLSLDLLAEAADGDSAEGATLLPRLAAPAVAAVAPPKKKKAKAKGKAKKKPQGEDGLDKRVIAGLIGLCLVVAGGVGYLGYDTFFKPASIIGHWEGSRTEHEKGKFLTHTNYRLILDGQKNAAMSVERSTSAGTYALQGDQLKLTFKDEDGEVSETVYRVALGHTTLDLFDPASGQKVVELIRFHAQSAAVASLKPAEAPKNLAGAPANKADDDRLAGVPFLAKDGAFSLRRPASWDVESGSRPDNTYSWVRCTQDSAKVQVFADIAGSLIAGSNQSQHEEGSPLAPVQTAHDGYQRQAAELFGDGYTESEPALFKSAGMGEGRVATFNATGSGLFGSKIRGIRVTFLTNDRRISIICQAPASQFEKYQPTFLALARSLGR